MQQYVELLRNRCPPLEAMPSIYPTGGASTNVYKLGEGTEVALCYLINTGEYCAEVVPQLESMVRGKIAPPLVEKVEFDSEVDIFMDLVAHSLKVLVSGVMHRLDVAFRTMAAVHWGGIEGVGEESEYVHTISAVLVEIVPKIRSSLGGGYFKTFCTKLASEILNTFLEVIMRQKKGITELGTQQLWMDIYSLKTVITHLHNLGMPADGSPAARTVAPPVYSKLVNSRTSHIEMVLKLVGTSNEDGMLLVSYRS